MADEPQTPQTTGSPPGSNGDGQTPPQTPPQDDPPGPVPYPRFKEVNDALKELKEWREKQEAMTKAATEKRLAEQQKWQELAETREKELTAERLRNTRQQVAMQKGIPADLVDRLQGATTEELQADADRLLQFIKPPTGPGVPPSSRVTQPVNVDLTKMNASQIRKAYKPDETS